MNTGEEFTFEACTERIHMLVSRQTIKHWAFIIDTNTEEECRVKQRFCNDLNIERDRRCMLMILIEVHYSLIEIKDAFREYSLIMHSSNRSSPSFIHLFISEVQLISSG